MQINYYVLQFTKQVVQHYDLWDAPLQAGLRTQLATKHHLHILGALCALALILRLPIKEKNRSCKNLSQRGLSIASGMLLYKQV